MGGQPHQLFPKHEQLQFERVAEGNPKQNPKTVHEEWFLNICLGGQGESYATCLKTTLNGLIKFWMFTPSDTHSKTSFLCSCPFKIIFQKSTWWCSSPALMHQSIPPVPIPAPPPPRAFVQVLCPGGGAFVHRGATPREFDTLVFKTVKSRGRQVSCFIPSRWRL